MYCYESGSYSLEIANMRREERKPHGLRHRLADESLPAFEALVISVQTLAFEAFVISVQALAFEALVISVQTLAPRRRRQFQNGQHRVYQEVLIVQQSDTMIQFNEIEQTIHVQ